MSAAAALAEPAEAGVAQQFVTFWIKDEVFGLPLAEVQEIIRLPGLVRVPMTAPSLEGIANLRGAVLPITNLRRIFGMEDASHDDATRVVVGNRGGLSGFVVDRMASVITTDPDDIEPIESISGTIRTDLLRGIVKRDERTIMLLDPPSLIGRAGAGAQTEAAHAAARASSGSAAAPAAAAADGGVLQLVSFVVADQEYAFPIEDVKEIVQVPPRIRPMPNSDAHVLGVMTLRSRLLPLVSLRGMFNMAAPPVSESNRIVVVTLDGETEAESKDKVLIGIVMDSVNEVLRVARAVVEPVPGLLVPEGGSALQAICRLADDRLVTILSPEKMFPAAMRAGFAQAGLAQHAAPRNGAAVAEGDGDMATGGAPPADSDEEQFVVFRLGREEFGVPISAVQEIVRVPEHLTRVPGTPAFVEGVVNLRGVVLPVIEQRRRFGLPEIERSDRQRIIVLMVGAVRTGFIVDSVVEVLKVARSTIGPAPKLSAEQQMLVDRVANLEQQKRMLLLIRPARLLSNEEQAELG